MQAEPDTGDLLGTARAIIERGGDLVPVLLYSSETETVAGMLGGDTSLEDMVGAAASQLRKDLGPPLWLAVVADSYFRAGPPDEAPPTRSLSEEFADGAPNVAEQIVLLLARPGQPLSGLRQVYRRSAQDGYEWEEPEPFEDASGLSTIMELAVI